MKGLRSPSVFLTATLAVITLSGCGTSSSSVASPRKQTIELGWHEAPGPPGNRLIVDVQRLVIRRGGWAVAASIENDTPGTLTIGRRHRRHGTEFGVLVLSNGGTDAVAKAGPGIFATRFSPTAPSRLRPGQSWKGTFSGQGPLPVGSYVRIELGFFGTSKPERPLAREFRYITDHALLLRRARKPL
jgi:hypothetical protein